MKMEIRGKAFIMNSRHTHTVHTHTSTLTGENHRKTANKIPLNVCATVCVCAAANLRFLLCRFCRVASVAAPDIKK